MYVTEALCTGPVNNSTGPLLPQGSGLTPKGMGCAGDPDCHCGCSKGLGDISTSDIVMYGGLAALVLVLLPAVFSKPGRMSR